MNGKKTIMQTHCNCGSHEDHLCYIISQGFHLGDEQNYLALIANPRFCCVHCGRKAARNKNLCVPMKL